MLENANPIKPEPELFPKAEPEPEEFWARPGTNRYFTKAKKHKVNEKIKQENYESTCLKYAIIQSSFFFESDDVNVNYLLIINDLFQEK